MSGGNKRWKFSENGSHDRHFQIYENNSNTSAKFDDQCKPPGFLRGDFSSSGGGGGGKKEDRKAILMRQAWAKAKSPGKQIMMSGLMMWLSGSTMSIFTLMMMAMVMINPITALFGVQSAFERYESPDNNKALWLPKLAYIGLNFVCVGIGIWKLNALGLLPTGEHIPPFAAAPNYTEYSVGMMM
mmetsp:Transcript_21628/g.19062  ORF Transcript_21628/g.19062 Transcript_21628/m.19062 type:complete len:185 (+) Transcript_21628:83-637(+)|eukprot:CAMPEP_0201575996 /NCGR_PEP_ID=MMETSP0190_2-20130828/21517_1 /ASSEMBLY_ACC=CAM_ASM_000263 /TAXON_ID=37353 /ORGANISM="Rosalina sp." /LENGTH=184 /DNA_ID=CAMNT_0048006315 /DNA_START=68 /DNA_END=622 /DNA_ORIENTATION=+